MKNWSNSEKGNNYTDLLVGNRSLVIKLLMKTGGCTRSDLAQMSGLSQAAITKITAGLLEMGIIEENGHGKGEKGRRTICLQLRSKCCKVLGVKIGRKSYSAGILDLAGNMLCQQTVRINMGEEPETVLRGLSGLMNRWSKENPDVIAAGVSVPGPYLRERGIIAKMTNFPGWREFNLIEYFADHVTVPVFVEHDAKAGALADWWFGNTQAETLVHIIASEGVGAGVINRGHLVYGADGAAGEIGHMSIAFDGRSCDCGPQSRGCLEQYVSALALVREVKEQLPLHPESSLNQAEQLGYREIFQASQDGDAFAQSVIRQIGFYFGIGIANVIYIYNPDEIVISDIMSGAGELMLESIRKTIRGRVTPELVEHLTIRYSHMKDNASLYGAAAIAVDRFLENPMSFAK